jgi:outer membrane protein OmpA-like peptidoglycan-associated protein
MYRLSVRVLAMGLCVLMLVGLASAQGVGGRWAVGVLGGGNVWVNDLNQLKFGPSGMVSIRYGISPMFSLGLLGGLEVMKTGQDPALLGLPYTYLHVDAYPVALSGYLRFSPNASVSPYFRFGAGLIMYKRVTSGGAPAPDADMHSTYYIPLGLGIEAFINDNIAIAVDLGGSGINNAVDLRENSSPDGILSAKFGLQFFFGRGGSDDEDQDGLTAAQEKKLGTNPKNADSDGDGLTDGDEVRKHKTNPARKDTDGDGLSDGDEIFKYHTDPNRYDTDGDGAPDGDEVLKYHTDPLKPDTDGDGLTDGDEVLRTHTDPLKMDTDGDGLSDRDEVKTYRTDPLNPDTDGDGIVDGEEVLKYHTDPSKADTDHGGINDGAEVVRGTDPLNPKDDMAKDAIVLERGKALILQGVNFITGSATLTPESEKTLRAARAALLANTTVKIEIAGYTDNAGSSASNLKLSQRRADAVRAWLIGQGIPSNRLTSRGYGASNPVASNTTAEGKAQNRRIEFHVK